MEIQQIMKRLDESRKAERAGIKTASVATGNNPAPQVADALRQTLRSALSAVPDTVKTAAEVPAGHPTGDLLKLAEDLTNAEEQTLLKQASLLGTAVCDGFMARLAQYDDAAQQVAPSAPMKMAQAQDVTLEHIKTAAQDPEFVKFAQSNPDLVKEAFDLGYQQQMQQLVKQADDEFSQGWQDAMTEVHKTASGIYKTAAFTINSVLRELQQSA